MPETKTNQLRLRQYPVQEHGDIFKNPTPEEFSNALHTLSGYVREPDHLPFAKDLISDISLNDPEIVANYITYALEKDFQRSIRPTLFINIFKGILKKASAQLLVSLTEKFLEKYDYNIEKKELYGLGITKNSVALELDKIYHEVWQDAVNEIGAKIKDLPRLEKLKQAFG